MRSLILVLAATALFCRAAPTAAEDKPAEGNRVERTAKKVAKSVEKTAKRAVNAVDRGAKAADKAITNAGEKTEAWVKKQTR